jgi:hypothetical protein
MKRRITEFALDFKEVNEVVSQIKVLLRFLLLLKKYPTL